MEEQHRRQNPLSGAGATPSMGLSQYRGGMRSDSESESDSEDSVGGKLRRRCAGGAKRKMAARRAPMSEAMAMGLHLGKHLHGLHGGAFVEDFGRGMASATGAYEGGAWYDFLDPNKNGVAHAFSDEVWNPQKNGVAQAFNKFGSEVGNEFTDPNSTLRGTVLPNATKVLGALSFVPGLGEITAPLAAAASAAQAANSTAKNFGLGRHKGGMMLGERKVGGMTRMTPEMMEVYRAHGGQRKKPTKKEMEYMEGAGWFDKIKAAASSVVNQIAADPLAAAQQAYKVGKTGYDLYNKVQGKGGKKKRAPAGPHDGRRARAEIVKKVMREKGMKMIEASKYVKAHGLY